MASEPRYYFVVCRRKNPTPSPQYRTPSSLRCTQILISISLRPSQTQPNHIRILISLQIPNSISLRSSRQRLITFALFSPSPFSSPSSHPCKFHLNHPANLNSLQSHLNPIKIPSDPKFLPIPPESHPTFLQTHLNRPNPLHTLKLGTQTATNAKFDGRQTVANSNFSSNNGNSIFKWPLQETILSRFRRISSILNSSAPNNLQSTIFFNNYFQIPTIVFKFRQIIFSKLSATCDFLIKSAISPDSDVYLGHRSKLILDLMFYSPSD